MSEQRPITRALQNGTGLVLSRLAFIAMPFLFTMAMWLGGTLVSNFKDEILRRLDDQTNMIKDLSTTVRTHSDRIGLLQQSDAAQNAELRSLLRDNRRGE